MPASKHEAPAVASEDLQRRLESKSGEVERLAKVVEELRRRVTIQKDRQESMQKEEKGVASAFSELQEDMSKWAKSSSEAQAERLEKLKQAKEQVQQQLVKGKNQLREAKGKLRSSVQSIAQQRDPLELEAKVRAQAGRLREALTGVLQLACPVGSRSDS